MPQDLSDTLVVGISSRSLFDLEEENRIFLEQGKDAYREYQIGKETVPPGKGTAFHLVEGLLRLNALPRQDGKTEPLVEVVVMSRNDATIGLRIFNAIEQYGLQITRAAFTSGTSLANYLDAFAVDLFLSKYQEDVRKAHAAGIAAAVLRPPPGGFVPDEHGIRIAFDGDAVLFTEASERINKEQGLRAFHAHEREHARQELPDGPFAKLLRALATLQRALPTEDPPIRLALVTARSAPAIERVIRTLRAWNVTIDESFFMGGLSKEPVLKAFQPHIFFDDQDVHLGPASRVVPAGHVPSELEALPVEGELEASPVETQPEALPVETQPEALPVEDEQEELAAQLRRVPALAKQ